MNSDGSIMNAMQSANYINNYFADVTKNYPGVDPEWLDFGGEGSSLPIITTRSVENKLRNLETNKAIGPFDPHPNVLKIFANIFAIPLADIFNKSFETLSCPNNWKLFNVCGIPKLVPCVAVEDPRPIALTSIISKVQESYVVEWMYEDARNRISDSQFGGLPASSAVLALVKLLHKWYLAMDSPGNIAGAYRFPGF